MPNLASMLSQISRRVFADTTESFERRLLAIEHGEAAHAGIVGAARMLGRMHDLLPYRDRLIASVCDNQDPKTGIMTNQADYECWPKPLSEATSVLRTLGGHTAVPSCQA